MFNSIYNNFLGAAPCWYKNTILGFLAINPIIYLVLDSIGLPSGFIPVSYTHLTLPTKAHG